MRAPLTLLILGVACAGKPALAENLPSPKVSSADITIARQRIDQAVYKDTLESPGNVVVVYFTPRNRKPALNHIDRIRRVVNEAANFYDTELGRHGFPGRSMRIRRDADGKIDVIDVVGSDTHYGREDGHRIRKEIVPLLRERRIDPDRSVLITFCNLTDYDPKRSTISHHSPFYGSGYHLAGNAW